MSTAHHPLLQLAPFFVLARTEGIENELNYLLGSNTPSKSRLQKMPVAAGMLQTEHFSVQAPEPGSVLSIGLARLKCETFKS